MKTASDLLRERIDPAWPDSVRGVSIRALTAFDSLAAKRGVLNANAADYVEKLRAGAVDVGKSVASARVALEKAAARRDEMRAGLLAKAFKHDDPRSAEMAGEIRSHVRSLPQGEAVALLIGDHASKAAQLAILEAPLFLSGVTGDMRDRVENNFLSRYFADDVAAIVATDEALSHAATSIELTRSTLEREGQFPGGGLEKWLADECKIETTTDDIDEARRKSDDERLAAVERRLAELAA